MTLLVTDGVSRIGADFSLKSLLALTSINLVSHSSSVIFIYTKMYKESWVLVKILWNKEGVAWMQ